MFQDIVAPALAAKDAELADLKNAGGMAYIRSEAIRNLKNDLDAAKSKLSKLEEEYPWRLAQDHGLIELMTKEAAAKDAELAKAKKDSARLEYLINNYAIDGLGERSLNLSYPESSDPRDIIDAAIAAASGGTK